jgi:hypothetical protein
MTSDNLPLVCKVKHALLPQHTYFVTAVETVINVATPRLRKTENNLYNHQHCIMYSYDGYLESNLCELSNRQAAWRNLLLCHNYIRTYTTSQSSRAGIETPVIGN